jgi:hypothetical protein
MFQEIGQYSLSSKHILTLGQLMHLALDLKQYEVSRVFHNNPPTHLQAQLSDVKLITIDPQMAVILVHVRKNIMEDVLLDGGLNVNIIIEDLRKTLGLAIPKPTPYTLRMVD